MEAVEAKVEAKVGDGRAGSCSAVAGVAAGALPRSIESAPASPPEPKTSASRALTRPREHLARPRPQDAAIAAAALLLLACNRDPKPRAAAPRASTSAGLTTKDDRVAFTRRTPVVGTKRRANAVMIMKVQLSVEPENGAPARSTAMIAETSKRTDELLAVSGGAPTKVKVAFDVLDRKTSDGAVERTTPSPVTGKTYVVEWKDGRTEVRDEAGRFAPKPEATEVAKHFRFLGSADPIARALPTTPLAPGDKAGALARSLEEVLKQGAEGMAVSDVTVTFTGRSGDEGVFSVALTMRRDEPPVVLTMPMKGEMRISTTTGAPIALELSGPIEVARAASASSPKLKVGGSGSISLSMSSTAL